MSDQPEVLRVADALEVDKWHVAGVTLQTAAELLREQHAEIERLRAENLRAFDSGYDKGVQDTLLDYGVEL